MNLMNAKSLLGAGDCQRPAVPGYEHSWLLYPLPDRPCPKTGFPGDAALHRRPPETRTREPKTGTAAIYVDTQCYDQCWLLSLFSRSAPEISSNPYINKHQSSLTIYNTWFFSQRSVWCCRSCLALLPWRWSLTWALLRMSSILRSFTRSISTSTKTSGTQTNTVCI